MQEAWEEVSRISDADAQSVKTSNTYSGLEAMIQAERDAFAGRVKGESRPSSAFSGGVSGGPSEQATTAAAAGGATAPDVEYGERMLENELAVALPIEGEDEDKPFVATAVEYDPVSKPPMYLNRRFQLYTISACIILILVLIIAVTIAVTNPKDDGVTVVYLTNSPTDNPSEQNTIEWEESVREKLKQT